MFYDILFSIVGSYINGTSHDLIAFFKLDKGIEESF